jgi:histidinol dehydrogenase
MKHSSLIQYSPEALQGISEAIAVLTETEGLPSHGDSVQRRVRPELIGDDAADL